MEFWRKLMADAEYGRGAFTRIGKDNGLSNYGFVRGRPQDGSSPEKGFNYEAVHLGVKSIEGRLVQLGYDVIVDGKLGPKVKGAVKDFQRKNGLYVSGEVGSLTGPALFKGVITEVGQSYKFDESFIYGVMLAESGGDPGAVGYLTPGDRGLFQFNTLVHDVTYEQAHDFDWATEAMFTRFAGAWDRYQGKGPELRINCSIAQHKSPVEADQWYQTRTAPSDVIETYVGRVRAFALKY
jgi:hypothetical protein